MKYLTIFLSLLMWYTTSAQDVKEEIANIESILNNEVIIDSLVAVAIRESYLLKSYDAERLQQEENVLQEKRKWLSSLRFGVNFFNVNTTIDENNNSVTSAGLLPNLGLTIGIDPEKIINRKSYVREAQYDVKRAENRIETTKREIKGLIIDLYYKYLEALKIVEIRQNSYETQLQQVTLLEEKFKNGQSRLDELLNVQSALNLSEESVMKARLSAEKLLKQIELFINPNNNNN